MDDEVCISHLLWMDTITEDYVLIFSNLVALKRENLELILIVSRIEWINFIDYFVLSVEADPYIVVQNNAHFSILGIYEIINP